MQEKIIGNKISFAIQIEVIRKFPVWGRIALWFCNNRLGEYESEDHLHTGSGCKYV